LTSVSLHLKNGARQGHSYYGKLTGTRTRGAISIGLGLPLTIQNHLILERPTLYRLSYPRC